MEEGAITTWVKTHVSQTIRTVMLRINSLTGNRLLFNYEGTIPDQLLMHLIKQSGIAHSIHVVCSTRPCMSEHLQRKAKEHADLNRVDLLMHAADCVVDDETGQFISVQCNIVTPYIKSFFGSDHGYLVLTSLLNSETRPHFDRWRNTIVGFGKSDGWIVRGESQWMSAFVFEGCEPIDIVATYMTLVNEDPVVEEIALCLLDCYNEFELRALIETSIRYGDSLRRVLSDLRPLIINDVADVFVA